MYYILYLVVFKNYTLEWNIPIDDYLEVNEFYPQKNHVKFVYLYSGISIVPTNSDRFVRITRGFSREPTKMIKTFFFPPPLLIAL